MKRFACVALASLLCSTSLVRADVKVPKIFGDHMVLQRGMKVPVWGTADAGEKVTVKVGAQSQSATAGADGRWRVTLDPLEGSKQPVEVTIVEKNTLTFKDVLIGEVWVCSGQSNMGFSLKNATGANEVIAAADRPTLRMFMVGRAIKDTPQDDLSEGEWVVCTPQSVPGFSAVAYFFLTELQKKVDAPMGLIQPSWGGTRAEAWIPKPTFDELRLPYEPAWTEQWLNPKQNPKAKTPTPSRPHEAPAALYNGMIHPLAGYAIKGVAWYQGETNTAYGEEYRRVLGALVTSWRAAWGQGDFPFLVVQLPNFKADTRFWPLTRESQAAVARELPNVGLAVTIDVGERDNLHPPNKLPVGQRLALLAEKMAYGMDVAAVGPTFKSMKIDGGNVTITFDHLEGGLTAKDGDVQGFELAGADGKFVPAKAKIEGETVVASAESVASPKTVRYGWQNAPTCTLYNKADLPAAPFEAQAP
jgi:sialate O-acetylesterase